MTRFVNTLSRLNKFSRVLVGALLLSPSGFADDQSDSELLRKIQLVQIPSERLNFKFSNFRTQWLTSAADLKSFLESSRTKDLSLNLPVQWSSESVLAIFWESKREVVRIPSFAGAEVTENDGVKQMRLNFNLSTPCFGIISDASPVQLVVVDRSLNDIDRIIVHTDTSRATNCH